jgi:hypothetical protein
MGVSAWGEEATVRAEQPERAAILLLAEHRFLAPEIDGPPVVLAG